ncbi:hypothetical protein [Neisseria meningitidis]|nr:hypothetical protein [Neisseria meningitidis]
MPSEPAGRLFQKMPYRCDFMRLYGVGFALQTACVPKQFGVPVGS